RDADETSHTGGRKYGHPAAKPITCDSIDSSRSNFTGGRYMAHSIITVATMKGGSGKSTLASCLAVHWQVNGRRSTILDPHPQPPIVRLAERDKRLACLPVTEDATDDAYKTAQRLVGEFEAVIIDTPGFRSQATLGCLAVTDFVLVPVK